MILNDRPDILSTLLAEYSIDDLDDEQILHFQSFMNWYNNLSQLNKDIYYLTTIYSVSQTAQLMQVSYSFIYARRQKLLRDLQQL